jgi:Fur family zinc uptake transcriptional regulator
MYACTHHNLCIEEALQKADLICKDKGLRFTEIRRKILEMIWASHAPSKAYDILDKLQNHISAARPTTVYRSLDFLLENGLIHKLSSLSAYIGCTHPLKHKNCYFLICSDCGEIKECCDSKLTNSIQLASKQNNFKTKQITVEIIGTCQNCKTQIETRLGRS